MSADTSLSPRLGVLRQDVVDVVEGSPADLDRCVSDCHLWTSRDPFDDGSLCDTCLDQDSLTYESLLPPVRAAPPRETRNRRVW